jgi:hypothetical protein
MCTDFFIFRKPWGKRLLGRQRHMWDDDIKMDLRDRVCEGVDCCLMLRSTSEYDDRPVGSVKAQNFRSSD